jgi:hypothetical protein
MCTETPGRIFKKDIRTRNIAQWYSACLACVRPWVSPLALKKKKDTDFWAPPSIVSDSVDLGRCLKTAFLISS